MVANFVLFEPDATELIFNPGYHAGTIILSNIIDTGTLAITE